MSAQRTLRKIHYWLSPFLLISVFVISVTGVLLAVKKDFASLQPKVVEGTTKGLSDRPISSLVTSVRSLPGHEGDDWKAIDRIDIAVGGRATVTYMMRVGAGVRPGGTTSSGYS